ncbi:MAG: methyltransferase domain-containing protein [Candidatus Shapirobacteria bacterium]
MKNYLVKIKQLLEKEIDPAYKRRAGLIFENLELNGDEKILEIGCGRGFYVNNLAKFYSEAKIWGIDLNENYLKIADKKNNNLKLLKADATKLPFENNFFDRIIASEILEHIPNDQKALEEMYRVLKPGGTAVITVPNHNYPFLWDPVDWILEKAVKTHLPSNIWWMSGIWADHVRLYFDEEMTVKLINAGFKIVKKWTATHFCLPFAHFWFYAVGKNLVEKGWLKNFNRFENETKESWLKKAVLWPIKAMDVKNEKNNNAWSSVNLIYKITKSGGK